MGQNSVSLSRRLAVSASSRQAADTFHNLKMRSAHLCAVLLLHSEVLLPVFKITSHFLQLGTSINTEAMLLCMPGQAASWLKPSFKTSECLDNYEGLLELVKLTCFKVQISCSAPFPVDGISVHPILCLEKSSPACLLAAVCSQYHMCSWFMPRSAFPL